MASVDDNQQRFVAPLRVVVEQAEQPVVPALRSVHTYLEEAGHLAVHRFPVAAARESLRRRSCDSAEHGRDLGPHVRRTSTKKQPARSGAVGIVLLMTPEVDDVMDVVR